MEPNLKPIQIECTSCGADLDCWLPKAERDQVPGYQFECTDCSTEPESQDEDDDEKSPEAP